MAFKIKHSYYKSPTPAFWRKIGDSLLAVAAVIAVGGMWQFDTLKEIFTVLEIKCIIGGSIALAIIGKFLTNFFKAPDNNNNQPNN